MKASWECQRWRVASLSSIVTSGLVSAAAAKILAGRAEITIARAAEIGGGRVERTDAMLLMVEVRRVTTLLAPGAGEGGGWTSLLLMRMDAHALSMEWEEEDGEVLVS